MSPASSTHSASRPPRHRTTTSRRHRLLAVWLSVALTLGLMIAAPAQPASAATCPCTIFGSATPVNAAENDSDAVELGVKFRADQAGFITKIRFYKGTGNGGTHTGSLWNTAGTRLGTVTFTGETATGWQQATFAAPIAVSANTTYVASYYAPQGHYAADETALSAAVTNSPLTALANGTEGGNGVYRYGAGGGYPASSYNATNYFVDVEFNPSGADTVPPTVTAKTPAAGATDVPVTSGATATFSEDVQPATIAMTLTTGSTTVASTKAYDAASKTVTLTPGAALTASTTYTVNLSGAKDSAGNTMTAVSWSFTTAAAATGCPCTLWPSTTTPSTTAAADNSAVELGVKFRSSQSGYITGIRFYKGTGNTGTHVGSLWTTAGTKLASVTFAGETATGWQQATFSSPVPISAATTYVASYYAPVGRYAVNNPYFTTATTRGPLTAPATASNDGNGVYRYGASAFPSSTYQSSNYWVDVVFALTATDTVAPTVAARTPAAGASGVSTTAPVTATYSEPVVPSTVAMELRGPGNALVPSTVTYDASSQTSTLTPSAALAYSTAYTVNLSGAKDSAGNTMTATSWSFTTAAAPPPSPDQGPGGPIAVITSSGNPYSKFVAEILRTEGLNEFATVDIGSVTATTLASYDVVILGGSIQPSAAQLTALTDWVNAGGNLIALRPDASLASLLGITIGSGPVSDGYLKIDTTKAPGAGIVGTTIQYHGPADRYTTTTATPVAALYTTATAATTNAAVTLRSVGSNGGQTAAFSYDLARSIALTRQGNPAWAGTERDNQSGPIRSDDMFFGGSSPDWVDFSRIAIPQADEQQRLLANLIQLVNSDRKPLPRFWYFPKGLKAVVVATGDDHGNNGTQGRFDQFLANSPSGCSVSDWTCYRYSSYLYPNTPLANANAVAYDSQGFEVGVHESTNCGNYTAASVASVYANDISAWRSRYPTLPNATSTRMHCIAFSDWASQPKVEVANGIRMDTNYYYWPASWIQDRPGFMTGSGMPMRFTDVDGTMIDNYQAATQWTDESGQTFPYNIDTLLDNALGSTGYYGAFVANFHTDLSTEPESDALLASAKARNVPIVSGRQMSNWIDGRNGSAYTGLSWSGSTLSFTVSVGSGATNLTGMLPVAGPGGKQLTAMTRGGTAFTPTIVTVKGLDYAQFSADAASYTATYGTAAAAPAVAQVLAKATTSAAKPATTVRWTTSTTSTSKVLVGTTPATLKPAVTEGVSTRKHAVTLTGLKPATRYYYRVVSTDATGRTTMAPAATEAPAVLDTPALDVTAPKLSPVSVTPLADGTALVQWTTDELATDTISLGSSANAKDARTRPLTKAATTDHSVVLTRLTAGATYYLTIGSTDLVGNLASSDVVRFVMSTGGVAQQSAAAFRTGRLATNAKWPDMTVSDDGTGSLTLAGDLTTLRRGVYVSAPLDAHQMVDWDRAVFKAKRPAGSSSALEVRFGSTTDPDGKASGWSEWTTVEAKGRISGSGRYIQYRVGMSAPIGVVSPSLYGIGFSNNGKQLNLEGEV